MSPIIYVYILRLGFPLLSLDQPVSGIMLRILSVTGDEVATLAEADFNKLESEHGKSVGAVKTYLRAKLGLSRFRQRLLGAEAQELRDDTEVVAPSYLHLVRLAYDPTDKKSLKLRRELTELCYQIIKSDADDAAGQAETLLRQLADPNKTSTAYPHSALHMAVSYGCLDTVRLLLEAEADPNMVCEGQNRPGILGCFCKQ